MTAETMFREYKAIKREASVLKFQLGRFEGVSADDIILSMQFSHPGGEERVQTSTLSDKTASVAMNYRHIMERENDEWFKHLFYRYNFIKEELDFFEECVAQLPEVQSGVIMDLLSDDMTWDNIACKYHVSTTMVSKYKKAAMKELNARYELRDRQTEAYLFG